MNIGAKIWSDIDKHGISIISTATIDNRPFTYTIGHCLKGWPELIVFGLDPVDAQMMFNELHRIWEERGYPAQPETEYKFEGAKCPFYFVEVDPEKNDHTHCVGLITRNEYRVLQIIVPDPEGRYPWNSECDPRFKAQPVLRSYS